MGGTLIFSRVARIPTSPINVAQQGGGGGGGAFISCPHARIVLSSRPSTSIGVGVHEILQVALKTCLDKKKRGITESLPEFYQSFARISPNFARILPEFALISYIVKIERGHSASMPPPPPRLMCL